MNRLFRFLLCCVLCSVVLYSLPCYAQDEFQFEQLFQWHGSVMLIIDSGTGKIEDANTAAINFYGYNSEELTSMRIQEINMLNPEEVAQEMAAAAAEDRNYFIFRHRLANGDIRHVEVYSFPIQWAGEPRLYSIIHDVTPRFETEKSLRNRTGIFFAVLGAALIVQVVVIFLLVKIVKSRNSVMEELKESEEKFRTVVQCSPDIVFTVNRQNLIQFINRVPAGITTKEAIGTSAIKYVQPQYRELVEKAIRSVFETGCETSYEIRSRGENDTVAWYFTLLASLNRGFPDEQVLLLTHDITERKQTEKELAHTLEIYRKGLEGIIISMGTLMSKRDNYTAGHQLRVAHLAVAIAEELGLEEARIEGIKNAAAVHDIGKIGIPVEILTKPGELTDLEYKIMQIHPRTGYEILHNIEFPWPLAEIVAQHHEKVDGSGYPEGLFSDDILLEAKIICVADVVEAMASHRPYRPSRGLDAALEEIERHRGILYDDSVVDACLKLFREKEYKFV